MKNLVIAALFSTVLPAQAAVQSYSFNGVMDSGFYNGEVYTGSFSFDDATIDNTGLDIASLINLNMDFLNSNFNLASSVGMPDVSFQDGSFLGLSWNVESSIPDFALTFVAGSNDTSDAFVAYDTTLGLSGAGNVIYAPVPEADSYAMFLAGLGLLGFVARRRKAA